jgi:hypothetical protein
MFHTRGDATLTNLTGNEYRHVLSKLFREGPPEAVSRDVQLVLRPRGILREKSPHDTRYLVVLARRAILHAKEVLVKSPDVSPGRRRPHNLHR